MLSRSFAVALVFALFVGTTAHAGGTTILTNGFLTINGTNLTVTGTETPTGSQQRVSSTGNVAWVPGNTSMTNGAVVLVTNVDAVDTITITVGATSAGPACAMQPGGAAMIEYDATVGKWRTTSCVPSTGVGDVVGPASADDNAMCRFDGTTGKSIQSSDLRIDDDGDLYDAVGTLTIDDTCSVTGTLTSTVSSGNAITLQPGAFLNFAAGDAASHIYRTGTNNLATDAAIFYGSTLSSLTFSISAGGGSAGALTSVSSLETLLRGRDAGNLTQGHLTVRGGTRTASGGNGSTLTLQGGANLDTAASGGPVLIQTTSTGSAGTYVNRIVCDGATGNCGVGPDTTPDYFFDVQGEMSVDGLLTESGSASSLSVAPDTVINAAVASTSSDINAIGTGTGTITVTSTAAWPTTGYCVLASVELAGCTVLSGTSVSITSRGQFGSTAAARANGSSVDPILLLVAKNSSTIPHFFVTSSVVGIGGLPTTSGARWATSLASANAWVPEAGGIIGWGGAGGVRATGFYTTGSTPVILTSSGTVFQAPDSASAGTDAQFEGGEALNAGSNGGIAYLRGGKGGAAADSGGAVRIQTPTTASAKTWVDRIVCTGTDGNCGVGPDTTPDSFFDIQGEINVDGNATLGDATTDLTTINGRVTQVAGTPSSYTSGTCDSESGTGDDEHGSITATCDAGETAVVTFSASYSTAPHCVFSPANAVAATSTLGVAYGSASTTAFTITSQNTSASAATWEFWCRK
jgi:hypothetical protein